jgi:2-polyprenyl-3-methyl-5-hydroxy-6-metoxy-1,4-benzoquinol methylase
MGDSVSFDAPAAVGHYLTEEVDPVFLRAARDFLFPYLKRGRTLNIGLGYGVWDERLAELRDEVVGLDIDGELVAHFRQKYPGIRYVQADLFDYRPERPFDTVVASHVLEHVDEPVEMLRRCKSWLNPGGHLLLVVPNADSLHRQIGKRMGLLREVTDLNEADHKLGHRRVYTFDLMREHLSAGGLSVVRLCGVTLKPMSNAQFAQMPEEYLKACAAMSEEVGTLAGQIAAVASG